MLVAALVAGCGGSGGGKDDDGADSGNKGGGPRFGAEKAVSLSVPPAYRGDKGWDETLNWVPGSVHTLPVAAARETGVVALLHVASNGYTLKVHAADSGEVRWTSGTWQPPTPVEGAEGSEYGEAAEIPDVTTVVQDGEEYVVAYAHGMKGKDELHNGTEVVQLAVYEAGATGDFVKPLRVIDVPVSAGPGEVRVSGDGGRLMVGTGDDPAYPDQAVSVDVLTGKVAEYEDVDALLPQCAEQQFCDNSRVVSVSPEGPLVDMDGGGFGVPGGWFSNAVHPGGAPAKAGLFEQWNGTVYGVGDGLVLAGWTMPGKDGLSEGDPMWSVHDITTGTLRASMTCDLDLPTGLFAKREYPVVTSADGRYLAAGPVAFDLKEKRGVCLATDGDRKTIALASIRDDGTAYGVVDSNAGTDGSPLIAQIDLTTSAGRAEVLDAGVEAPLYADLKGQGLFLGRDENENVRVSLRQES
jgi:hypothetical protein